ncbi:Holliday junction branch migration protein RuvA [Ornithinimicrobium kibberense]|uniref:Holliday junction branch migration complex subunit RuvA n=1 Tax=Ornithinimicrobium kibberense TaxID=282060 RepID=A0ABV5V452_9MICO|nr:Holliday junction branch migration protein RuvA [Ornithinimicrobium kibberense]
MIASVRGPVRHVGLDRAVVELGGVGLLVHATPATVAELRPGQEVTLETTLVVREESLTLYGFADPDARALFEQVQTVSGVGPRLALAMLSVLAPAEVRRALAQGDLATLTKVPGIGRKSAERLVLELKDKVAVVGGGTGPAGAPAVPAAGEGEAVASQVREALEGLGWSARQAADAVSTVTGGEEPPAEVSAVLRAALRELGR